MSFIFAGTPVFAARVLRELVTLGRLPALVVSQPDRPRGRGRHAGASPVVDEAQRLGLPVHQSDNLNAEPAQAVMSGTGCRTLVVVAFGQILRSVLLERFLCLNVHASLLPAYRGAAPIERCLAAGDAQTGISIMRVSAGLDEGPFALQTSMSISLRDDAGSLARGLAVLGASGLDQVLTGLEDGTVTWTEQTGPSSYAHKLTAADAVLDLGVPSRVAHDHVRALSPHVGVRASSGEVEFKVWRTWPYGDDGLLPVPPEAHDVEGRPGVLLTQQGRLFAGCAKGVLELLLVQPAGKARMEAGAFLRGYSRRLDGRLECGASTQEPAPSSAALDRSTA